MRTFIGIAFALWLSFAMFRGFDETIKRQDIMLCNSAKVSGNMEYLAKCQCYYAGDSILCIEN